MTTVDSGRGRDTPDQSDAGTAPERRFASLDNPQYRLLFWSGTLVFTAVQGSILARAWLARSSNSKLGGTLFAFGIAMLVSSQFGGVLADRISKRRILIATNLVLFVSSVGLAVALSADGLEYWMLVVSSALQGVAFAFMGPARMAFTGELVESRHLPNAVALGQLSLNATRIVGPAIAGVAIGAGDDVGTAWVYYTAGILSLAAIAMVWGLPRGTKANQRTGDGSFMEGLRYVRSQPEVSVVLMTSFVVVMFGYPYVTFLTRLVTDSFGQDAGRLGLLNTVQAVGAVIMSLAIANQMSRRAWILQLQAGAAFSAGLILLGFVPNYLATIPVVLILGAANAVFQTANNTLALTTSEPQFHGRIQSLMMLSFSGFGIAALPLGILADSVGLQPMFIMTGVISLAAIAAATAWRLRRPA